MRIRWTQRAAPQSEGGAGITAKQYASVWCALVCALALQMVVISSACCDDITTLGGDLTTTVLGHNAIQLNAPNVVDQDRAAFQRSGFAVFHRVNSVSDGLGPRFANKSCGGCHVDNGKGPTLFNDVMRGGSTMIIKVARKRDPRDSSVPRPIPGVGTQLAEHSINGRVSYDVRLSWDTSTRIRLGPKRIELRKPRLSFKIPHLRQSQTVHSLRMSPILIGLGLIEAIPEEQILARVDSLDSDSDGISGRPQYVPDVLTQTRKIGRFGFKGSHPTVAQQTGFAAFSDIGLANDLFKGKSVNVEMSSDEFDRLVVYQMLAGVPAARKQDDANVRRGQEVFSTIGCEACHTMTFSTGASSSFPELHNQTIHPFSDFLLHDMGSGLADGYAEFQASGSEWRTTPLWGLGFAETVSDVKPRYLHDGRARTIEEAILWHGGEAQRSQGRFRRLSSSDRTSLIAFLRSL